jgi:hypothetical protein
MKLLLLIAFSFVNWLNVPAQIGAKTQQSKIYGNWQNNSFGYQMMLVLRADGTGEFDGDAIKFVTQANKLIITQSGVQTTYDFTLQGNSLTVSGGDLDKPVTFTGSGSIAAADTPPKNKTGSATSSSLIGTWSNYGETIAFDSNGQCTYLGQTYPYSVAGNNITLQTAQGNVVMEFNVNADRLMLTVNGKSLSYTKGKPGSSTATKSSGGSGKLDQSLVGKWCYVNVTSTNSGGTSTDQCITINGDGTYQYYSERSMSANTNSFSSGTASQNSDSGTWWMEGDRIYYNSQAQGQGSYQLIKRNHPKTGDPMIVLDGTSYVTFFQKSPW